MKRIIIINVLYDILDSSPGHHHLVLAGPPTSWKDPANKGISKSDGLSSSAQFC